MSYISAHGKFNDEEHRDKTTYECLRESDQTLNIQLVFTQIQDFQRPIPFEDLRQIRNPILIDISTSAG